MVTRGKFTGENTPGHACTLRGKTKATPAKNNPKLETVNK